MLFRLILISLVIICCTVTDIHANEIAFLTPPITPLHQVEEKSQNTDVFPSSLTREDKDERESSPKSTFEDAIGLYKAGKLNEALEKFRFLADNLQLINNPEIAGTSLFMTGHITEELGLEGSALYFQKVIHVYPLMADYAVFRSAESVERTGNPMEAANLYKRVYDSYPESGLQKKALLKASKNYLTAGNTNEARAGFKTFMDVYPKDSAVPEALYNMGMSYLREGNESDAQDFFRTIWVYHPVSMEARLIKTMVHLPLSAEDAYRRGTSYYNAGYYEMAISEYKRVLSQKKSVSKTTKKDASFQLGMSYFRLRMSSEAEQNLELFLAKYPHDEKAPEAVYWLGRNYLRRGKEGAFIASSKRFVKQYKKDKRYPEVMFRLGNIYAESNDIENAFLYLDRIIREYPLNSYAAESLWKKGWILYKTGNMEGAMQTFNTIINSPGEHAYKAHALYWRAKILEKRGDYEAMDKDLCGLCSDFGKSFHCLFSKYYLEGTRDDGNPVCHPEPRAEIDAASFSGNQRMLVQEIPKQVRDDSNYVQDNSNYVRDDWEAVFSNEEVSKNPEKHGLTRIRLLLYLGLKDDAIAEALRFRNRISDDKETALMLASIFSSLGEYNRAMHTIRPYIPSLNADKGYGSDNRLWPLVYPAGYSDLITKHAVRSGLDPFLVYAIIREESWFNKEAVSPAGALGLMQLMPGTAKRMAKESYAGRESLFDPAVNIELGTKFLSQRLIQFDGNIFLAIASYNAGPEAVERWMNKLDGVELDEFIEDIPYKETREYVKKVFRSYMEYNRLYKEETRIDTL
ncbi:MAG: hypothetical protein A2132_05890 [Nitrospirae bacterium RBG_16_43_11]|nr:MAG: hypothetical protein A2132_05890 [Nitrospirae bacterium RBG_16_43_11]